MSEKKKSHGVQLLIRTVVTDPKGKVIQDSGQKPSKSFVIQFLEFIRALGVGDGAVLATATDGTEQNIYHGESTSEYLFEVKAGVNVGTFGIIVGTGDTAVTNADYKLETQLTEGTGAGEITHGEQVVELTAIVSGNVDIELKRALTNLTGSTITVKEAGLYCTYSDGAFMHCLIRDVLVTPVELPDNCSLTVYYTVRTTV